MSTPRRPPWAGVVRDHLTGMLKRALLSLLGLQVVLALVLVLGRLRRRRVRKPRPFPTHATRRRLDR